MKEYISKEYSKILDRDLEYAVYGNSGKVCFIFPELSGRFYDFKNFGLLDSAAPWIEQEKLKIICTDSIDKESWDNEKGNNLERIELQEKWFKYVIEELYPKFVPQEEKAMVCGCSMGGYHAGIFFFRRPDLFDIFLSLSGLFDAKIFFKDYQSKLVYKNSPIDFLKDMPKNHFLMEEYRKKTIITCVGQGLWEEELLKSTKELDRLLTEKEIPHWSDYWGFDVSHDWYWWRKQLSYFLEKIFNS